MDHAEIAIAMVPRHGPGRKHRQRRAWLVTLLQLCGCAVEPEPGWQTKLERQIGDPARLSDSPEALATPAVDEDPAAGDGVVFAITLEEGERTRNWQLEVQVESVAERRELVWRDVQEFEQRVQPGEGRQRQIESSIAASRKLAFPEDYLEETPVATIRIEAFDAAGASAGKAESAAIVSQLRRGLLPAARAGYRQRELMRGRVEAGKGAPMLTVDDAAYDDIQTVGEGVAAC